jgi:hypothetical protein
VGNCPAGQTFGGSTAHYTVCYDDTLPNGAALAATVIANGEQDFATLEAIWTGFPAPQSIQVSIISGGGGGVHFDSTEVWLYANANTDGLGIPGLLMAEVAEMFMSEQEAVLGKGFNPSHSHGEGLSRVMGVQNYPAIAGRFSTGSEWLNSIGPTRPDWVTNTEPTDQDYVSIGCAALFLNYLRHQLGFTWQQIIAAADNTLALVATNLGVHNAYNDFYAVLARHYPVGKPASNLPRDSEGFVIDDVFPLSCLYMRHNLTDDGTSHSGALSESPDIIVKNGPVTNPQAAYSTPASIANDAESDPEVIDTQANYLYLRAWNLGATAANVTATAYWSPPATLVTPNMWKPIGQAQYPQVPAGRVVEVSVPGITWGQAAIPNPGHYCFVATVGDAGDPAPTPGTFAAFDEYVAYIQANNNIVWRNFNVVDASGNHPIGRFPGFLELPFLITGAWDVRHAFELEVAADLPKDSRIEFHAPAWLSRALSPAAADMEEYEDADLDRDERRLVRMPLNPHGSQALGKIELEPHARVASKLLVRLPVDHADGNHGMYIRQLHRGREVGRITWRFAR